MPDRRVIDEFEIESELGRGGMGVVFKAHDSKLARSVAIKVLSSHLAQDENYVRRFLREAQAGAQLSHPNIVKIHSVRPYLDRYYIAMDYIEGKTVAQLISSQGPFKLNAALSIVRQTAGALSHAHERGIVHRDIKPDNIMMQADGHVQVMDFGLARSMEDTSQLTATGAKMGTPKYMTPQQCEGKPVDARADVYSLGVTLFEMLAGRAPYDAGAPLALMYQIVNEPMPCIIDFRPELPPAIHTLIASMTAKDPDQRCPNAAAVIQLVDAILDEETTHEAFMSTASRLLPVVPSSIPDGASGLVDVDNTKTSAPPPAEGRRRPLVLLGVGIFVIAAMSLGAYLILSGGSGFVVTAEDLQARVGDKTTFVTAEVATISWDITEKQEVDGEVYYHEILNSPQGVLFDRWRVMRPDGLYSVSQPSNEGLLRQYIKLPLTANSPDWVANIVTIAGRTRAYNFGVEREETIQVPAGEFRCLLLRSDQATEDSSDDFYIWLAPGVGLVQSSNIFQGNRVVSKLISTEPGE